MSRDAKIGLLVVFASITLGLFLGFAEVMDREYIKVNGKDGDGSGGNEDNGGSYSDDDDNNEPEADPEPEPVSGPPEDGSE
jgi:hypothetical protein